jgi:hypothetical protein
MGTIEAPKMPLNIPVHCKWLLGQGAGTWFCIDKELANFRIRRYTPIGELDCDRVFKIEDNGLIFDIEQPYEFEHISHCSKCRISQNGIIFIFNYTEN